LAETYLCRYEGSAGGLQEVSRKGIRVVRVSPGWVETEAAAGLINELATKIGANYEGARKAACRYPDRTAGAAARSDGPRHPSRSPRAASITGTEYVIDDGTVPTV
jgi:NAD(P)-dependent dehydrogenase (short-subunit alcohol dehydrogenase family)